MIYEHCITVTGTTTRPSVPEVVPLELRPVVVEEADDGAHVARQGEVQRRVQGRLVPKAPGQQRREKQVVENIKKIKISFLKDFLSR